MNRSNRRGASLIEVLVVLAILAILIGLLLPAVQNVRMAAAHMKESNKLRQYSIGVHSYLSANQDRFPNSDRKPPNYGMPIIPALTPYLEMGNLYEKLSSGNAISNSAWQVVQTRSELDPSFHNGRGSAGGIVDDGEAIGNSSYAFNDTLFQPGATILGSITDGTTNTLSISHHYARCGATGFLWQSNNPTCAKFLSPTGGTHEVPCWTTNPITDHASTFSDSRMGDAMPYSTSNRGPLPTPNFQVAPLLKDCDFRLPQAFTNRGLMAAMADGSVRMIRTSVSTEAFWAAVTPNGGEVIGLD